jgi:Ca-activated chloride channel family protein
MSRTRVQMIGIVLVAAVLGAGLVGCGVGPQPAPGTPKDATSASGPPSSSPEFDESAFHETVVLQQGTTTLAALDGDPLADLGHADEVWVIARPAGEAPTPAGDRPTAGLRVAGDDGEQLDLPLEHTDVRARIDGSIGSVTVTQRYGNPFLEPIEAIYVFPLPQDAAVSDFVMVIGERRIRGVIREREEAERVYQEAREAGYAASLLHQERPNVFTQKVANIAPGARIDVELVYFQQLVPREGEYAFVVPTVVGPRYNPPGFTDGIGAVDRGDAGTSAQRVAVPYLQPGERSGHDLSLAVELEAGVPIEELASTTHAVEIERIGATAARARLADRSVVPDRDFVLRYRLAGDETRAALFYLDGEPAGWFALELHPPRELALVERAPVEMIFVVDCSGSMSGQPLAAAQRSMHRALDGLQPDDTFQIIRFSSEATPFGNRMLPATPENLRWGHRAIDGLEANGGTEILRGIRAALGFPRAGHRLRIVTFMTDGYIGNEEQVLRAIDENLGSARVFSFGVGSSTNRYLLERMAQLGRGAVAYVGLRDESAELAVDTFYRQIAHPALAEITLDWGTAEVFDVYPQRIPDLLVGRPVLVTGRYRGALPRQLVVEGRAGGHLVRVPVPLDRTHPASHPALAKIWARQRIANLALRGLTAPRPDEYVAAIRQTALDHGLMSAFTSFVAVDASGPVAAAPGPTVHVPVPVPDGVAHDTTVPPQATPPTR